MCFCTNDQNFTQATYDPYADYVEHPGHMKDHKIAFVYKFEYYNHRLDHHFALHALDICTTRGYDPNPCLNWPAQHADWCHTFHTPQVPDGVKYHQWEFCYQFRGDTFHNPDHLDAWTFYKDKREVPRKRTWMGDEALVRERCGEVCRDKWGMDVFEDRLGTELARVDYFDKFDDICYHGSAANDMGCDWNQGGG
ncbi:MAG: hypothetical protein L6R39_002761 [Caloplaca ligustica]|nr:MAG: hypothetical protein L6R39_002761 [Caloplaca ligustica]